MAALKKRNLIVLAVIILVIAIVLSSFVYLNYQKPYKGPNESLVFGDLHTDSSELIYVAQDQHYFEANGINIIIKNYATNTEIISALTSNQISIATSGEFPFVSSVLAKQNLSTIASMDRFEAFYLIGRKDHGIQNILDLKGKTIGVRSQSLGEFYLGRFLDLNGMGIRDVTSIDILPSQWVESITNGTVDAIVVSQLYVADIQGELSNNIKIWPCKTNN
jgi:ABC-type nitrate/sulfonate/bicarbonate transport system substrate-binding protein